MQKSPILSALLFFLLIPACPAAAQQLLWDSAGVPICTADGWQRYPRMATDGARGAIIAWEDIRVGSDPAIYAARIDAQGQTPWTADGVELSSPQTGQRLAGIVSDGSGGAYIAWWHRGSGDGDLFMQRVDGSGSMLWQANGATVCDAGGRQEWAEMITDGSGGVIIAWHDRRGSDNDIYAQRFDRSGTALWKANGLAISTATGDQSYPQLARDQRGGAFIAWMDRRTEDDIYAQHVLAAGTVDWNEDFPVCVEPNRQVAPKVLPYGESSVAFFWQDYRLGPTTSSLYLQVIDDDGNRLYPEDYEVSQSENAQSGMFLTDDGQKGALAVWTDYRKGVSEGDVYMRRILADGSIIGDFGNALCDYTNTQERPTIISDGHGGGFAVWQDKRSGFDYDIYMNRVSPQGQTNYPGWNDQAGQLVIKHDNNQLAPQVIHSGAGYALICWYDGRTLDGQADIYAQRVAWAPSLVYPDSISFGIQKVGQSTHDTIRIFNEGATPLTITNIRRASDPNNTNPRDFTLYPTFTIPTVLLPSEGMNIALSFLPEGTGDRYSELRISSNAPQDPVVIPLRGIGTNPRLLAKNVHQFKVTKVGAVNEENVVDIFRNTGSGVLLITGITFEGNNADLFSLGQNPPFPLVVEEGSSIALNLRFAPEATGPFDTNMFITSNASETAEQMRLSGFGAQPSLIHVPVGLHFDTTMTERQAEAEVRIRNTSGVELNVTDIQLTGTDADQFTLEAVLPMRIPGEAISPFTVRFNPTTIGLKRATILITSDAPSSPDDMVVDGAAILLGSEELDAPRDFAVHDMYPQPLRAGQQLYVDLAVGASPASQRIALYDMLGRNIAVLHEGELREGRFTLRLPVGDIGLAAGTYMLQFTRGQKSMVRLLHISF